MQITANNKKWPSHTFIYKTCTLFIFVLFLNFALCQIKRQKITSHTEVFFQCGFKKKKNKCLFMVENFVTHFSANKPKLLKICSKLGKNYETNRLPTKNTNTKYFTLFTKYLSINVFKKFLWISQKKSKYCKKVKCILTKM